MVSRNRDGQGDTFAIFRSRDSRREPLTTSEVADALGASRRVAAGRLEELVDRGMLETKQVGDRDQVWWLSEAEMSATTEGTGGDYDRSSEGPSGGEPAGVLLVDDAGEIAWIDRTAANLFDVDQESVVGQDRDEFVRAVLGGHVRDATVGDEIAAETDETAKRAAPFEFTLRDGGRRRTVRLEYARKSIGSGRYAGGWAEFFTDVTDRSPSTAIDDDLDHLFRSLNDAAEEYAIMLLDPDGHVIRWNVGAERLTGYAGSDVLGEHFSTFYPDEAVDAGVPSENLSAAIEGGSVEDEGWRVRADESRFWANVTITAIHDDGELRGFTRVTQDVTGRRELEQELETERNLLENIIDTVPVSVGVISSDGEFVLSNQRAEDRLGIDDLDEAQYQIGTRDVYDEDGELIPPEDRPYVRVFETGEAVRDWHCQIDLPDHGRRWLSIDAVPVPDDDGEVAQVVVSGDDISHLKEQAGRLERQRGELQDELDDVFERVSNAFIGLDESWRFTYVNDEAAEILGRSESELLGASIWDEFEEAIGSTFDEKYNEAIETQEPVHFEEYYPPLDTWFEVGAYPSESGLSVYFDDVSERKERERELEESRQRYSSIVENFPNGAITLVDQDLQYVTVGGSPRDMVDVSAGELEGRPVEDVVEPELADELVPRYRRALGGEASQFEVEMGDRVFEFRVIPVRNESGEVFAATGMSQDVTAQVTYQRELEAKARQQEVIADLGQRALGTDDLDALFEEAVELVTETLDSEYCKILDLHRDSEDLLLRASIGLSEERVGSATVDIGRESQAGYTLLADEPIVVEDMAEEDRFAGPDRLMGSDVESGISAVIGSRASPWGVLATHDTDRRDFSDDDALFVQSVANILATAIERRSNEVELEEQREHLAALDNLNSVVRDINEALVEQSTREEIERTVCERLADSDSYRFAWTAEVDPRTESLEPNVEAGVDGYLEGADIRIDDALPEGRGPAGRAARSKEIQVSDDALSDPTLEPWRDAIEEYGYRSCAAIPIVYQDTLYGILGVYTDRIGAFADEEQEVVAQLGEIIGHAIASIERKQALMSDDVVEIDIRMENLLQDVGISGSMEGQITFTEAVSVGNETFLQYGTTTDGALETIESLVDHLPHWDELTVLGDETGETRFELRLSEPPVISTVADNGGYIDEAVIENDTMYITIHLPPTVDVRRVVSTIQESYSTAKMVTRQQVSRNESRQKIEQTLTQELTDRQRAALEASFHAGFFDWPRESSGEEVAESLDVSAPTFHQHLRKAQQKLLETILA